MEAYVFHELRAWIDYRGRGDLHYWRTTSGFEVDFILNGTIAIEVKAKRNVGGHDLKGLHAIADETKVSRRYAVSLEARARRVDGIEILPWREFLSALWKGKLLP